MDEKKEKNNQINIFIAAAKSQLNKNIFKKYDRVVYTANFGSYDQVLDPLYVDIDCCYICFTDNKIATSPVWSFIYVSIDKLNPRLCARIIKHLPHKIISDFKESIWVDAKYLISGSQEYLWGSDFAFRAFEHRVRKTVFLEFLACAYIGHDKISIIIKQFFTYKLKGSIDERRLIRTCVLYRRHNDKGVCKFQDDWFNELCQQSIRDQLSFGHVALENDLNYESLAAEDFKLFYTEIGHSRYGLYNGNGEFYVPLQRKILSRIRNIFK
jgi:hypothetical protein